MSYDNPQAFTHYKHIFIHVDFDLSIDGSHSGRFYKHKNF